MQKSKILLVGKVPPPYLGTSVWFEELRKSSLSEHFEIIWFNVNVNADLSTIGHFSINKTFRNLSLYYHFATTIRKIRPELVMVPISQSTIGFIKDSIYIWLSKRNSKTVIVLHGSNLRNWLANSWFFTNIYFTFSMRGTYGAIVLGYKLRKLFEPWFYESKIFVIPNGLDMNLPDRNTPRDGLIIVRYIGSISFNKGVDVLVEAIGYLNNYHKKIRLIINGKWRDNKLKADIERKISDYKLPVSYEGEVTGDDKIKAYHNTDIFVFTPVSPEGHPMVIVEAMASGLPVISTDQGAISESVLDNINGYIVKAGDYVEIAEKIKYLTDNPEIRIKMGKESRRIYEEKFTLEKMINRYKEVFTLLIKDKV